MSFLRTLQGLVALLVLSLAAACTQSPPAIQISKKPTVQPNTPQTAPKNEQTAQNTPPNTVLNHGNCQSDDLQVEVLLKINKLRASGGFCGSQHFAPTAPVRWNTRLQQAADMHAQDMAQHNFFNHKSATNGSTMPQRLRDVGYQFRAAGENIAAGQVTVADVVETWRNSPPHCSTLLKPEFVEIGVSCQLNTKAYYKSYWTLQAAAPS